MTNQEIFDKVARHLLTQKVPAREARSRPDRIGMCLYRTKDGKKCAAGCLIPDELYSPQMEGEDIQTVLRQYPQVKHAILGDDVEDSRFALLGNLQSVHDMHRPEEWKEQLAITAHDYSLSPQVLHDL